jgi:hypothetical protein
MDERFVVQPREVGNDQMHVVKFDIVDTKLQKNVCFAMSYNQDAELICAMLNSGHMVIQGHE